MAVRIARKRAHAWLTAAANRGIDVHADKDGYLSVIADLLDALESDATRCPNCDNIRLELGELRRECERAWREVDAIAKDEVRGLREANAKLVGALDMVREALHGGEVEDLLLIVNSALSEYHRSMR